LITLTLYGRRACHLCEDMKAALTGLQARFPFAINERDVDGDALLERDFGDRVPVLTHGSKYLCHYHLDEGLVAAYLAEIS
jgi:glutaredoxin